MNATDGETIRGRGTRSKNAYKNFFLIFLSVCAYIIVAMLFQFAAMIVTRECFPELFSSPFYDSVLSAISLYVVALPVTALIMLFVESRSPSEKTRITFGEWMGFLCVAVAMLEAGNFIGNFVTSFLGLIPGVKPIDAVEEIIGGMPVWASVLLTVVAAPITEEFIFRKLMIDRMAMYGGKRAIFVSALCFGLMHGNFSQFFYAFLLGLLFGYIYEKTGNLLYSISLHATVNLVFGVIGNAISESLYGFYAEDPASVEEMYELYARYAGPLALSALMGLLSLAASIIGVVVFAKNIGKLKIPCAEYSLSSSEAAVSVWTNAGAVIYYALCIFLFVSSLVEIA